MTKSELFKAAHAMTRKILQAGDDYRVTFGAALRIVRAEPEMAALSGSEKQIAWAESIRAAMIAGRRSEIARMEAARDELNAIGEVLPEASASRLEAAREELAIAIRISSAKFWIDNRFGITRRILMKAI